MSRELAKELGSLFFLSILWALKNEVRLLGLSAASTLTFSTMFPIFPATFTLFVRLFVYLSVFETGSLHSVALHLSWN